MWSNSLHSLLRLDEVVLKQARGQLYENLVLRSQKILFCLYCIAKAAG